MMRKISDSIIRKLCVLCPGMKWFLKFREVNRASLMKAGFRDRLWALKKGFFLKSIELNRITRENFRDFLSDRTYFNLHPLNNGFSAIIDNKFYLPFLLKEFPEHVPEYYYFMDKGRAVKLNNRLKNDPGIIELCREKGILALKQYAASYGLGFCRLEWNGGNFLLNQKLITQPELESFLDSLDKYLVTEYVIQHKYAEEINPGSVNTIRLVCARDNDYKWFIMTSYHRFGLKGSCVDNMGSDAGGLLVFIEKETGKLRDTGFYRTKGKPEEQIRITQHPDSMKQVADVIIPHWQETISKVLSICRHISFLRYFGLDLTITDDGFKILEINSLPGIIGLQAEGGYLRDECIRRFYLNKG